MTKVIERSRIDDMYAQHLKYYGAGDISNMLKGCDEETAYYSDTICFTGTKQLVKLLERQAHWGHDLQTDVLSVVSGGEIAVVDSIATLGLARAHVCQVFVLKNDMLILRSNTSHWCDQRLLTRLPLENVSEVVVSLHSGNKEKPYLSKKRSLSPLATAGKPQVAGCLRDCLVLLENIPCFVLSEAVLLKLLRGSGSARHLIKREQYIFRKEDTRHRASPSALLGWAALLSHRWHATVRITPLMHGKNQYQLNITLSHAEMPHRSAKELHTLCIDEGYLVAQRVLSL